MYIASPLPSSLKSECEKCGKILASFISPKHALSASNVIPPSVLANAKGLAILSVAKAGFLFSGRFGSGLVIARTPDGGWSAPSAIMMSGGGFGGQVGFEITDFVYILNDAAAVKTFEQAGSLTFGGNMSLAAGPVGVNGEAAAAANTKAISGIFAYSKTKGVFAGVSVEGSGFVERKEANEKLYGPGVSAKQLLSGAIKPPQECDPLLNVLRSGMPNAGTVPTAGGPSSANQHPFSASSAPGQVPMPQRPAAPQQAAKNLAVALFNFDGDQPGDLSFRKGEVITVLKKTESNNDWWTGMIGTRHGIFPSNYVKMKE